MKTLSEQTRIAEVHKEMCSHIRNRVKVAGIKSRVSIREACGVRYIQVSIVDFAVKFTDEQQRLIREIAKVNGLTWNRGGEIIVDQMTNPDTFQFVFSASQ